MKLLTFLGFIILTNISFTYETDEYQLYKEKYKDEKAVVLNHNQTVNASINKKTGKLDLYRTDYEEVLYLSETSRFYTSRYISLSDYFQDITSIKVTVYTPKGKKIILKPEDFRTVDATPSSWVFLDDDKEIVFDLKELGEGYRSVITYTKKLKKPEFFGIFDLMSSYPLEKGEVSINYPNEVKMVFTEMNLDRYKVDKTNTNVKGLNTSTWVINDVEPYKREKGSLNIRYYMPQVLCRIESYKANGKTHQVMSSTKDLHAYFQEFLLAKGDEKNRGEINRTIREITEGMETDLEKIDTIFKWVQTNIKYLAFEDGENGFVPRSCTKVMKDRYGDCKDMGNLLVEMLTYAKVKGAHVAWVGTRDIPYQMSEYPSPRTCNHVICVVDKPDGGYYYLDATSSEVSYLIPPSSIQGKELLINYSDDKFKLFKVEPVDAKINTYISVVNYKFTEGDSIYGNGKDTYTGYQRLRRTYRLKNYDNEDLYDYVKGITLDGFTKYTLKDYTIENLNDNVKPLYINYNFSFKNPMIKYNNQLIFNPDIFDINGRYYYKKDYKQTQQYKYQKDKTYIYNVEIPEGYEVKIPENSTYKHDLFSFECTYKLESNILTVTKHFVMDFLELPPSLFDDWNQFSAALDKAAKQNIILTKKN